MFRISKVKWKEEFSPFVTLNIPELSSRRAADLLAPIWCESQTQHSTTDVTPITESHLSGFLRYFYTNTNFVPLPQIYYSHVLYPIWWNIKVCIQTWGKFPILEIQCDSKQPLKSHDGNVVSTVMNLRFLYQVGAGDLSQVWSLFSCKKHKNMVYLSYKCAQCSFL